MDLPMPRELELETLLRQRDAQVADLTDEVTHLRQFLANQPPPSTTEPTTIPPALMSLLLPHLNQPPTDATSGSSTVTTALVQRVKILQEENDELYELLKTAETGRLKEDVRALRRVVQKLEGALRESHQVIAGLSAELERSQDSLLQAHGRQPHRPHQPSPAPRNHQPPPHLTTATNGTGKLPPTGPRAHKKPRLSESQISPTSSNSPLPIPPKPHLSAANATPRGMSHDGRGAADRKPADNVKMEVDDDARSRLRSPVLERDRPPHHDRERDKERDRDRPNDRARNRDRERDRERDRDRDQDRSSRRNGNGGGGGGGGRRGRRSNAAANNSSSNNNSNSNNISGNNGNNTNDHGNSADRTLAERMGL
ncbi:hypothetical protein C2E23DRAFT_868001 [Lenzites betulinus]|nr:hypothetical protein C2E23DRAFT_868001 [Lenzites betulinus]